MKNVALTQKVSYFNWLRDIWPLGVKTQLQASPRPAC